MNIKALIKSLIQRKYTSLLLCLQMAVTVALLVNSLIITEEVQSQLDRPTGLPLEKLLVVRLSTTSSKTFDDDSYYESIIRQDLDVLKQLDGVNSVAPYLHVPIKNGGWNVSFGDKENKAPSDQELGSVGIYHSTYNMLENWNLSLIEGRVFSHEDEGEETEPNIVITQSLAKAMYDNESALGRLTNQGRIIGVVSDFMNKPDLLDEQQYAFFVPQLVTNPNYRLHYVLNVKEHRIETVREQVEDLILNVHPERDITNVTTMKERHREHFEQEIGLSKLFFTLCLLMLFVTIVSSFAYAQFHVSRQRKFMGIRRALGAKKQDVFLYVLAEQWLLTFFSGLLAIAFVIGLNMLLDVFIDIGKPSFVLYLLVLIIVFMSSSLASMIPAWKTSQIPPVEATKTL